MPPEPRRMLAPWTVEEGESSFIVRTANGFVVSITYFDDEPQRDFNLRKDEARRLAVAVSRLPELLANKPDSAINRATPVFFMGSLKEILEMTLAETVRSKGSEGARWLEQYESELILSAKRNTHSLGLSYDDEANLVSSLIELLKYIFAVARRDLAEGGEDD
jgi:hypothetical protein